MLKGAIVDGVRGYEAMATMKPGIRLPSPLPPHEAAGILAWWGDGRFRPRPRLSMALRRLENRGLAASLGRIGSLEVRLASTAREVKRAQRLRYRVFYEEMTAVPDLWSRIARRDRDSYDAHCDHLLVVDHAVPGRGGRPRVVGTYRLLRQDVADRHGGFYTAREFDLDPLLAAHYAKRFLELGRSCVLASHRTRRTVDLLWRGIYAYVLHHGIDVMVGCASLEGADPARHAAALAFLHRHAAAPAPWRVGAVAGRRVPMAGPLFGSLDGAEVLRVLPPLLKGYLRLGAMIGDGAVIDRQFDTTDVLVVLPVERISARYRDRFAPAAIRFVA